jgi:CBS domain-containing protein
MRPATRVQLLGRLGVLRVADVMTPLPLRVGANLTAKAAAALARRRRLHHLLVEMPNGAVGAVCLFHLRSADPAAKVADCVCDPSWVGPLPPELPVEEAAEIMNERAFRCLPVVAGGLVLGVVTGGDLRRAGLSEERASPRCSACGTREHVHEERPPGIALCADCADRARPPDEFDELGVGG